MTRQQEVDKAFADISLSHEIYSVKEVLAIIDNLHNTIADIVSEPVSDGAIDDLKDEVIDILDEIDKDCVSLSFDRDDYCLSVEVDIDDYKERVKDAFNAHSLNSRA